MWMKLSCNRAASFFLGCCLFGGAEDPASDSIALSLAALEICWLQPMGSSWYLLCLTLLLLLLPMADRSEVGTARA
jgi:hypothetical protein